MLPGGLVDFAKEPADQDRLTIAHQNVGGYLRGLFGRQSLGVDKPHAVLRMQFHPNIPVISDKRPEDELRSRLQELHRLNRLGRSNRGGQEAVSPPHDHLGFLLVEAQDLGVSQHRDVRHLFQSSDKHRHLILYYADAEPALRDVTHKVRGS